LHSTFSKIALDRYSIIKIREIIKKKNMVAQVKTENKSLYDTDYNLWVLETVQQLENRDFNSVDWDDLIE
jgi:hypothetical protein